MYVLGMYILNDNELICNCLFKYMYIDRYILQGIEQELICLYFFYFVVIFVFKGLISK